MDPLSLLLQPPVFYPVVPYVCTIFGGLQHGRMILIHGSVGNSAERFQIDFQCGCSTRPRSDVAFHFNPRFSSSSTQVICNTLRKDQWLDELKFSGFPLRKGGTFVLLFLFLADKVKVLFTCPSLKMDETLTAVESELGQIVGWNWSQNQVSIAGQHFLDFPYRLPLRDVDTLGIYGDVTLKEISFLCSNPLKLGNSDLNTPLCKSLPAGLSEGHLILARGLVTEDPEEMTLSLKSKDVTPFKLTASFKDESLYYNHSMGQSWSDPQRIQTPFFVFHAGRYFEILVLLESGKFRLAINGTPLGDFSPLKSVDELEINGSALIYSVKC